MKKYIATVCGVCSFRTQHETRTKAYRSMTAHENETNHEIQFVSEPQNGAWVRFHKLDTDGYTLE